MIPRFIINRDLVLQNYRNPKVLSLLDIVLKSIIMRVLSLILSLVLLQCVLAGHIRNDKWVCVN